MSAPIPREEPEDPQVARCLALAQLIVHFETRGAEWFDRERFDLAGVFFAKAARTRAELRAVVRSEVST